MTVERLVLSDQEIIQRCRRGDEAAFAALMDTHQQYVFQLGWRLVGSREDAMDLTQEVFERLLKSLSKLDPQPSLRPWLRRVTINTCLKSLERVDLRQNKQQNYTDTPHFAAHASGGHQDTVAEEVQARLTLARVAEGLDQLTRPQRLVLVLKALEGMSYEGIAEVLAMPVGTVKSHLSRARRELRRTMLTDWGYA